MTSPLAGTRVLLVEDETLVAMLLEETLEELGCEVIGPVSRLDAARTVIQEERLDCALLDVNLRGQTVYPVAELLAERSVPFGFVTGYGPKDIAAKFGRHPVLRKPFQVRELAAVLTSLTGASKTMHGPARH